MPLNAEFDAISVRRTTITAKCANTQEHCCDVSTCVTPLVAAGEQRLEHLLHGRPLFRSLWVNGRVPDAMRAKLKVLDGDLSAPDCGLSQRQLARLRAEVDWVIHSAASISFFEHVHTLLEQNYLVTHVPRAMQQDNQCYSTQLLHLLPMSCLISIACEFWSVLTGQTDKDQDSVHINHLRI